jgi:hypothetical protein
MEILMWILNIPIVFTNLILNILTTLFGLRGSVVIINLIVISLCVKATRKIVQ